MYHEYSEAANYAIEDLPSFITESNSTNGDADSFRETSDDNELESDNIGAYEEIWLDKTISCLRLLCEDPWFTSLWTLQEAFLCPNSIFLSKEAENTQLDGELAGLKSLLTSCEVLKIFCERVNSLTFQRLDLCCQRGAILKIISISGLNSLNRESPMALYAVARHRKASKELDYIYGIMQVFDLRLGRANPDADQEQVFSLYDLEDQLGEALMLKSPLQSQSFVHTAESREFGKNWRIDRWSTVPGPGYDGHLPWELNADEEIQTDCRMSTRLVQDIRWGWFTGQACPFVILQKAWTSIDIASGRKNNPRIPRWMDGFSAMHKTLADYQIHRGPQQYELAMWMVDNFESQHLKVLHLGSLDSSSAITHFGLILLHQSVDMFTYWHRLGICMWEPQIPQSPVSWTGDELLAQGWRFADESKQQDIINGHRWTFKETEIKGWEILAYKSSEWQPLDGLFG